jgi:hypothetical protein
VTVRPAIRAAAPTAVFWISGLIASARIIDTRM